MTPIRVLNQLLHEKISSGTTEFCKFESHKDSGKRLNVEHEWKSLITILSQVSTVEGVVTIFINEVYLSENVSNTVENAEGDSLCLDRVFY